jgi:hypothetical protein
VGRAGIDPSQRRMPARRLLATRLGARRERAPPRIGQVRAGREQAPARRQAVRETLGAVSDVLAGWSLASAPIARSLVRSGDDR